MKTTKLRQWFIDNELNINTLHAVDDDVEFSTCDISGYRCNVVNCTCEAVDGSSVSIQINEIRYARLMNS